MSRVISDEVLAALNIWMEARGEPFDGKVAVGRVMRNRMAKNWYGHESDLVGIVLQPFQFSGWNSGDPNRRAAFRLDATDPQYQDCLKAWQTSAMSDAGVDDACFYFNPAAVTKTPEWAIPDKRVAIIGNHQFFRA